MNSVLVRVRPALRRAAACVVCCAMLAVAFAAPRPVHAQAPTFSKPLNNVTTSLASAHAAGSDTLVVKSGDGPKFTTPSPTSPVRVTVARASTLVNNQIGEGTAWTVYLVTARSGDTLSGLTAVENTSDRAYSKNDRVQVLITAGALQELQDALGNVPTDANVVHKTTDETIVGLKQFQAPGPASDIVRHLSSTGATLHKIDSAGTHTVNTQAAGDFLVANNTGGGGSTVPFRMTYAGFGDQGGGPITDNVFGMGWSDDVAGYPIAAEGFELAFVFGNTACERYMNYRDPARLYQYRPWQHSVNYTTSRWSLEHKGESYKWYAWAAGIEESAPSFTIDSSAGLDKTSVTLRNKGDRAVLTVNCYDPATPTIGNDVIINTASGSSLQLNSMTPATLAAKAADSPALRLAGHRWDGAASAAVSTTVGLEVRSDGVRYYTRVGDVRHRDDGVSFISVDPTITGVDVAFLGSIPRLYIPHGYLATPSNEGNSILRLIGSGVINTTEDVISIAPAGTPINLGGPIKSSGAAYTDKALRVQSSAATGLFSVTGDGRVYIGSDNGAAATLNVLKPAASGGNLATLQDLSAAGTPTLHINGGADAIQFLKQGATGTITFGNLGVDSAQITLNTATRAVSLTGSLSVGGATALNGTTLGFYGTTPITRPATTGQTAGFTAGVGAAVLNDSSFTGGVGPSGYTIGDLVKHLKSLGLLAQCVLVPVGASGLRRCRGRMAA